MYALATLLSLLAVTCFVHAFVLRDRRFLAPFAILAVLLAFTHNWGLFVLFATGVAFLLQLARARRAPAPAARRDHGLRRARRPVRRMDPDAAVPVRPHRGAVVDRAGPGQAHVRPPHGVRRPPHRAAHPPRGRHQPRRAGVRPADQAARASSSRRSPGPEGERRRHGGRGAAAHRPRRPARGVAVVAGRAGLHDALLRGHRRPGDRADRRRAVQRPCARDRDDDRRSRSCGGTTVRGSSTRRATSAASPPARCCARSTRATSWSPRTPSRSRCCATTSAAASGTRTRWARSPTRRSWTGATRWTGSRPRAPREVENALVGRLEPGQALILVQPILRAYYAWRAPWTAEVKKPGAPVGARAPARPQRLRRVDAYPRFGLSQPPRGVRVVLYRRR